MELAQAALHRRLDRGDDDRQLRVTGLVAVHRREEVLGGEVGVDAKVGHRGEVGVAQLVVPAVQVAAMPTFTRDRSMWEDDQPRTRQLRVERGGLDVRRLTHLLYDQDFGATFAARRPYAEQVLLRVTVGRMPSSLKTRAEVAGELRVYLVRINRRRNRFRCAEERYLQEVRRHLVDAVVSGIGVEEAAATAATPRRLSRDGWQRGAARRAACLLRGRRSGLPDQGSSASYVADGVEDLRQGPVFSAESYGGRAVRPGVR